MTENEEPNYGDVADEEASWTPDHIFELDEKGYTQGQIALELDITPHTVAQYLKKGNGDEWVMRTIRKAYRFMT